eukprot:sb/3472145/
MVSKLPLTLVTMVTTVNLVLVTMALKLIKIPGWNDIVRDAEIALDLENSALEFQTYATIGEMSFLQFQDSNPYIRMSFESTTRTTFRVYPCTEFDLDQDKLPDSTTKTWMITKTETNITLYCEGVEMEVYNFEDEGKCLEYWRGDVIDKFRFTSTDSASMHYRIIGYIMLN